MNCDGMVDSFFKDQLVAVYDYNVLLDYFSGLIPVFYNVNTMSKF